MAKPFSERLATALQTDRTTCETLRDLIAETRAELEREQAIQRETEAQSVDVLLNASDRDEAAATADRAKRLALGYADAIDSLQAKLEAKENNDRRKREADEKSAAIAQRDELAARFRAEVPKKLQELTELFAAVERNAAWLAALQAGVRDAEAEARDVPGNFVRNGVSVDRYTRMNIPDWGGGRRMWPRDTTSTGFARLHKAEQRRRHEYERSTSPEAIAEAAAASAAEEAKWTKCRIGHNRCALIFPVEHRRGAATLDQGQFITVQMNAEQMESARAKGVTVEIVEDYEEDPAPSRYKPTPHARVTPIPMIGR